MTDSFIPRLTALTPGSGVYLNEADFQQPDWQTAFYGENYKRLLAIKDEYDPRGVFYAPTGVGSEAWKVGEGGRLCAV